MTKIKTSFENDYRNCRQKFRNTSSGILTRQSMHTKGRLAIILEWEKTQNLAATETKRRSFRSPLHAKQKTISVSPPLNIWSTNTAGDGKRKPSYPHSRLEEKELCNGQHNWKKKGATLDTERPTTVSSSAKGHH
ncbi:hypothetical protein IscW_ISCW006621 [Ixodes scapularis]|uniref:Uncharacterized protein n=1 Tax=Ixodes scapularis TaxID=6945 RepID=B7PKY2_IXOSC|nr:hypothetical protein IscW_ISCW006621 [Ixodes scapularis]|eukprot:XP_002434430.1 hypothetical protein IscW_ISCW006621 [Ixodes scapularis]